MPFQILFARYVGCYEMFISFDLDNKKVPYSALLCQTLFTSKPTILILDRDSISSWFESFGTCISQSIVKDII